MGRGCNHTYGIISIYFYEDKEVIDKGRSKKEIRLKRRHVEKARFLTSFGTENMNEKCKPRVLITHDDRATLKLSDNMLYGQRNNVRCLMESMRELPAHPSALLVHKVSEDIRVVDENLDRDERCVLTSSGHFCLEPNGEARINLGVSLKAPVGTKITLSPTHSDNRELWDLISHNAEIDKTGELIARVRNYSNTQIINYR